MPLLSDAEIGSALAALPGWSRSAGAITKTYELQDFAAAIAFVDRVAAAAEAADHHPDIDIRWNKVTLALSTHSAGGLTGRDVRLAAELERLAGGESAG